MFLALIMYIDGHNCDFYLVKAATEVEAIAVLKQYEKIDSDHRIYQLFEVNTPDNLDSLRTIQHHYVGSFWPILAEQLWANPELRKEIGG